MSYIAYGLASVIHLYACLKNNQKLRAVSKCILMPLLFLAYVFQGGTDIAVICGLACGWIGDIILLFPNNDKCKIFGSSIFAIGHVFYLNALTYGLKTPFDWKLLLFPMALGLVGFLVYLVVESPIPKDMKIQCLAYFILLGIMAGASLAVTLHIISLGSASGVLSLIGYLFFMTSDGFLVNQWYTVGDPHPVSDFKVMLTYIIAQLLIIMGFI